MAFDPLSLKGAGWLAGAGGLVGAKIGYFGGNQYGDAEDQSLGEDYRFAGTAIGAIGGAAIAATAPTVAYKIGDTVVEKGPSTLEKAGEKILNTAETIGNYEVKAAKKLEPILEKASNFLFKETEHGFKLTGKGSALILGASLIGGIAKGFDTYTESRMGMPTGIVNSTPEIPPLDDYEKDMAETYGAGGDLVFALNRNRRG